VPLKGQVESSVSIITSIPPPFLFKAHWLGAKGCYSKTSKVVQDFAIRWLLYWCRASGNLHLLCPLALELALAYFVFMLRYAYKSCDLGTKSHAQSTVKVVM